jgi:hypothetical protein
MRKNNKGALWLVAVLLFITLAGSSCIAPSVTSPSPSPSPPQPTQPPISPVESPTPDIKAPQVMITKTPPQVTNLKQVTFEWTATDNRTPTSKLTYSYYLQGYDSGYSPFTADTTKTYADLPDGSYVFNVKSRDEAGNISPTPATFKFTKETVSQPENSLVTNPIASTLLIVPNSDVSHIAVGYDGTIYALDSPNARLYKSDHGGYGWTDISKGLGASEKWTQLAIATDNPKIVAVATNDGREVFLSTDGGVNFTSLNLAGLLGGSERVECLAISSDYGRREIAVGTSRGNGNGRVWINVLDGFSGGWQDMSTDVDGWTDADIFAIAYSPQFAADSTLLAVAATGPPPGTDNTYLYIGSRDLGENTTHWNNYSGYPVQISQSGQDTPGTPLTYADIALPSDYEGSSPASRHVYACWSDNPPGLTSAGNPNDDVYRIDDTVCYRLFVHTDAVCSLAHYGTFSRGKLLAGAVTASTTSFFHGPQVYFTANPDAQYPTWQSSQKPPTGPAQARVAWSADGRVAYCGTSAPKGSSNDQSAFSVSTNNGFTWNQIGLIDL